MEDSWLAWARQLQAISSTGIFFGESDFDKERYEEINHIANQMLAQLGNVPIARIEQLFSDVGDGYVTPKVDVRAAVFRNNEILLVKEKLDGLWTMPGGYADVGLSAVTNVVKEVQEEANIKVKTKKLIAVVHKAQHEYDMDARDFYKLYFLCEQVGAEEPCPGAETESAGYYKLDSLPPQSTGRVIKKHIDLAFEHHQNPDLLATID